MSQCPPGPLLRSFWMGGYEGADHVNAAGEALDMVRATGHLARLDEDYRRAARLGLRTLRETIGWRLSEGAGGALDLGRAVQLAQAARRAGIQPLWTLMHYGLPPDLSFFDDALIERFARFAGAVARALRPLCEAPRFYTPVNEISFLAWAASCGGVLQATEADAALDAAGEAASGLALDSVSSSERSGYQVKRRLVRAALAGMAAIRAEDPQARFLHIEPLVHVAAPPDRPELDALARQIRDYQWQALDLLSGRLEPGLGGHERALDWLGFNHYHSSQWEAQTEKRLAWHLRDPRRLPVSALLLEAFQRYRRPLVLAETGHVGMGRAAWLHEMAGEALQARALGLPLQGICLYPLLDRPDWCDTGRWHRCGLWQPAGSEAPAPAAGTRPDSRVPVQAYARALRAWRGLPAAPKAPGRRLLVLLPVRWEGLDAPLQRLLRRLAGEAMPGDACPAPEACFSVLLVEPPRPTAGPPLQRRHRLGPALELLVLHEPGAHAGWATPGQDLTLLRAAVGRGPEGGTLTWLMRWPLSQVQAQVRRTLPGNALLLQPDAQALPPDRSASALQAALLLCEGPLQAAHWSAQGAAQEAVARVPVLRLPLALPARALRPPPALSYEAQEIRALLGPATGPRLLVMARPQQAPDPAWLEALARLRPAWQFLMLGSQAPAEGSWPATCRGLGELAPELLPALLQAADAGLVLAPVHAATEHLWPELAILARGAGLPLCSTPLAEMRALPPCPGLTIAATAEAMAQRVDALLAWPRTGPRSGHRSGPLKRPQAARAARAARADQGALAAEARHTRALERALRQAFAGLLPPPPPPLQPQPASPLEAAAPLAIVAAGR